MKIKIIAFCIATITLFSSSLNCCAQNSDFVLQFQNIFGNKILTVDSNYTNAFGEPLTVHSCKYYISHIVLQSDVNNKSDSFPSDYFLIDDTDTASKKIELKTSLQNISSIHFLLGVDSLMNVNGVQSGDLDPAKGMFWTWNTGYVMAKLEGISPVAKTPGHAFSYHVGGYKQNEQTVRSIDLMLPHTIHVDQAGAIIITADIGKWFNAVHNIKIGETPFCHEPGSLAVRIADNYANMFSIVEQ